MSDEATPAAVAADPWSAWREATPARIALGRAGVATPTAEALKFGWAHSLARDAIHTPLDVQALEQALRKEAWEVLHAASRAPDRTTYLRRPDLGRRLLESDAQRLGSHARRTPHAGPSLAIVVGDGLSSLAAQRHVDPFLKALKPRLPGDLTLLPVTIVQQARVAVADEVGHLLGADMVLMMIGERPGLSSPDSLGLYLTHRPHPGRNDAERNCISNVRPEGLDCETAAFKLVWLLRRAFQLGLTGVGLKDESDLERLAPGPWVPSIA